MSNSFDGPYDNILGGAEPAAQGPSASSSFEWPPTPAEGQSVAPPVLGDDVGIPEPPVAPPAPPSRAPWILAVTGALVLLLGGGFFAFNALGATGGAETPEEAIDAMLLAIENEDFITLGTLLEPGERRAIAQPVLTEILPELQRLGVFDESFDAGEVQGIDFEVSEVTYRVDPIANQPDIVHVRFTGGTFAAELNAAEFPIGDRMREYMGEEYQDVPREENDAASEDPVVLVQRDGRWYFSGLFTAAENIRIQTGHDLPMASEAPPALGSETPSAAVEAMIAEAVELDLDGMIGRTDPEEFAVMYRYSPLFLDDVQPSIDEFLAEARAEGFTWSVDELEMSEDIQGDDAIVSISGFTARIGTPEGYASLRYSTDRISGEVEAGELGNGTFDMTPRSLVIQGRVDEETIDVRIDVEGQTIRGSGNVEGQEFEFEVSLDPEGECSAYRVVAPDTNEEGCLEDEGAPGGVISYYADALEELGEGFPAWDITTRRTDGEWYVAPISTSIDWYVAWLERLDPEAFEEMFSPGLAGPGFFGMPDDILDAAMLLDDGSVGPAFELTEPQFEATWPDTTVPFDESFDVVPDATHFTTLASGPESVTISGTLTSQTYDIVVVDVGNGGPLTISVEAADPDDYLDTFLVVRGPDGSQYTNDDAEPGAGLAGVFDSQVVIDAPQLGTWEAEIRSLGDSGTGSYNFTAVLG